MKSLKAPSICLFTAFIVLVSCEQERVAPTPSTNPHQVETIDGPDDPILMEIIEPFEALHGDLEEKELSKIQRLVAKEFMTYTIPLKRNADERFSKALIVSVRGDQVRYSLFETAPHKGWDGNVQRFTGTITTYSIGLSTSQNPAARTTQYAVNECTIFVIDGVEVYADLSAVAYGHYEQDPDCVVGSGSSPGFQYNWVSNWQSYSSGNWFGGGQTGSGGGGGGHALPDDGVIPIPFEDISEAFLETLIEEDPFVLLDVDCSQIEKWQQLAQHVPPQSVLDKLNNLDQALFGDFELQDIQDASGAIVNMDYFPVTISVMPKNPLNGKRFTPEQFLEHIRKNLNQFIDVDYSTFSPSTITGLDEAQLRNSSNPLGSILHVDIPTAGDGSVICSSRNLDGWTFSTIEVPYAIAQGYDGKHPVSGNRYFGFITNPNGSYTFFTRGVDRITGTIDAFFAENIIVGAFEQPDNLWNSLKSGIYAFVTFNQGLAVPPSSTDNIIERPDWDKVSQVLVGERPVSDLGCN